MKFSVLLPTRNRLEYLRHAVESVRRQDYGDWEIVISDNHSDEDIEGFVRSLADDRIIYVRTDSFLPVTDNWNNALVQSTGDYVVMLGDDDGLLPGYFTRMLREFETFADPDFVYVSALFFAYPGVMPEEPDGFLKRDRNRVFPQNEAFWLDHERAIEVTKGYLSFRMPVASNMQFSLISRRMIDRLSSEGAFFQSPYPDFYATPLLFLESDRILILPEPMVVIGITPKSYGYFHFNNLAGDGLDFLNNGARLAEISPVEAIRLPGTSYNDSWLLASSALYNNFAKRAGLKIHIQRYRFLQIVHGFKHRYYDRTLNEAGLKPLRDRLNLTEKLMGFGMAIGFSVMRGLPSAAASRIVGTMRRLIGQHAMSDERPTRQRLEHLGAVYAYIERHQAETAHPVSGVN
jgi:glycosyltransferase involved in cell wall biosynthesis